MPRRLLVCAGILGTAAAAAAQEGGEAAACDTGVVALAAETEADLAELSAAVALAGRAAEISRIVDRSDGIELPRLRNRSTVLRLLQQTYPARLRDDGVAGDVRLLVRVAEDGRVSEMVVVQAARHREFNEAARRVASGMVFHPARHQGCPVPAWILLPFTYRPG